MTTADVYDQLTAILRDVFDDDQLTATPAMTANDVDGWDSLSNLRLMMSVEKRFRIKLSAAEIGNLKNVGALAELVIAKVTR